MQDFLHLILSFQKLKPFFKHETFFHVVPFVHLIPVFHSTMFFYLIQFFTWYIFTFLEFVTPDFHVRVVLSLRSGLVLSLVICGEVGPSTASLANQAPVYCGCPAGTHGCDLVSRVGLDQSANPVVVWLGLVSRVRDVIVGTWNMRKSEHTSSTRSWSRAGRL